MNFDEWKASCRAVSGDVTELVESHFGYMPGCVVQAVQYDPGVMVQLSDGRWFAHIDRSEHIGSRDDVERRLWEDYARHEVGVSDDDTLWYCVYETDGDSDYQGFGTQDEAVNYANEVAGAIRGFVSFLYVVPVPGALRAGEGADGEPWSLWDVLHTIDRSRWEFLIGSSDSYFSDEATR